MAERYGSMSELLLDSTFKEGVDYRFRTKEVDSPVLIAAVHGGNIEPGTTQIGEYIAGEEFNFYTFEGFTSPAFYNFHTAKNDAPLAIMMHANSEILLSLHNRTSTAEAPKSWIGGRDIPLRNAIWEYLVNAGFNAEIAPNSILGTSPIMPTNRNLIAEGVQIEMDGVLQAAFVDGNIKGERTEYFYGFCNAIKRAIQDFSLKERQGTVYYFPFNRNLKNYKDGEVLETIRSLSKGLETTAIPVHVTPDRLKTGVHYFYMSGNTNQELFQAYLSSLGISAKTYGVPITNLRAIVEYNISSFNTGIQTITIFNYGTFNNYEIYGKFIRASNYGRNWGKWKEEVFVVEEGSNANGKYKRYSNGDQECTGEAIMNANHSTLSAGIQQSDVYTWTFPASFDLSGNENAEVSVHARSKARWGDVVGSVFNTHAPVCLYHASNTPSDFPTRVVFFAKGRWRK